MTAFLAIVDRDVRLAWRAGAGAAQTLVFFALCVVIYAIAIGPDIALLSGVAIPILWASSLLAGMLSLDRLFQSDAEDGSLDMMAQRSDSYGALVLAKAVSNWLTTALPLIVATPALGLMLSLPAEAYKPLLATLLVGTPALSLIGALVAALTFPVKRSGILMTLLAGPLFAPVVIFGVDAANAGAVGDPRYWPSLLFLAASSLVALIVAPLAGAAAIRFNMQ